MTGDFSFIEENMDIYCEYMDHISGQILRNEENLPDKQVFSGDISKPSLYIHWLCVIYRGFKDIYGHLVDSLPDRAEKYSMPLKLFEESLNKKIYDSLIEIDKDTIFIPHTLSEDDTTWFDPITQTRIGSYWNLCIHLCAYFWYNSLWFICCFKKIQLHEKLRNMAFRSASF